VTLDTGHSTVDSQKARKRKRKRSSSQKIDSRTSVKTSNRDGHKQHSKVRKQQRKNLKKDLGQSVKDHKHSVAVAAGLGKKKCGAMTVKRKRNKQSL